MGAPSDSQSILEHLERANLFIVPLDDRREWYRYHQLFVDLLRQRLRQTLPDLLPYLHRRASAWYAEHAMPPEAIEHALQAEDYARAAELISQVAEATLMRSEVTTLLRWLDALPEAVLRRRADLCAVHAWTLLASGKPWEMVRARLVDASVEGAGDAADSSALTPAPHSVATLRAFVALFQGQPGHGMELARLALKHLPKDSLLWRNLASLALSVASVAEEQTAAEVQALEEVARASQAAGNILVAAMALCSLAELHTRWGQLHRAQIIYRRALDLATDAQGRYLPIASEALMGLGMLAREWNDLDAALDYLTQGVTLARRRGEISALEGYISLALVRQALGDADAAHEAMDQAQRLARKFDLIESDDLVVDMSQARLSIAEGDLDAAARWAERRGLIGSARAIATEEPSDYVTSHLRKYEHLILARLWLAQGRHDDALLLLEAVLPKFRARRRPRAVIEAEILRALAYQARGDAAQAAETLAHALTLASRKAICASSSMRGRRSARCWLTRQGEARQGNSLAACGRPSPQKLRTPGRRRRSRPLSPHSPSR
jgi:LuxR family maltose regulon positive regulatory protein